MSKGGSGRSGGGGNPTMGNVYTAQGYIDEGTVAEKQANHDYDVSVTQMKDDNKKVWMVVDGNHSLEAAKRDHKKPNFIKVKNEHKSVEIFVTAFNDLDNPVNVKTGSTLW